MRTAATAAARLILYGLLFLWAFLLFCVTCARLSYTNFAGPNRPLSAYDPHVGELLVSSILTLAFVPTMFWFIRSRSEHPVFGRVWLEIVGLSALWLFWICGAGAASHTFGTLYWCHVGACSVIRALLAFAWLGWITLTALLIGSLTFAIIFQDWNGDLCDSWGSTAGVTEKA